MALTQEAGRLRRLGRSPEEIEGELLNHPGRNGLPPAEIRTIARSIGAKPPGPKIERLADGWQSALHELADRRGWPVAALKALGAVAKGAEVHIPMKLADGRVVGWRRRRADNQLFKGAGKKALTVKGGKAMLIMPEKELPPDIPLAMTESETDAVAIIAAGHRAVLATPGGNPSSGCIAQAQKVAAGRTVVLFPDPDEVGDAWRQRLGGALLRAGCRVLLVPPIDCDIDARLRRDHDPRGSLAQLISGAIPFTEGAHHDPDAKAPAEQWPDPQPLIVKVAPEPYPLDALPETIQASVKEVQGFTKAPMPLVASAALGAVSIATQAHVDVKRAERLSGPSSLSFLCIADSGERKTTCDGFFMSAIREYEQKQAEDAKPELKRRAAKIAAWTAERDGILLAIKEASRKRKETKALRESLAELEHDKPEPLRVPKLLRMDDTPESLAWVLAKEWPSAGVASSDAGIVFGSHGMGKDSIMRNLSQLNILWDGGALSIGRRTKESFDVRGARLTMALQVQEATLRAFFDKSDGLPRGIGFLARFLVAWPESTQGFRPFTEAPEGWPALAAFHRGITEILEAEVSIGEDGGLRPVMMPLAPAAKAAWVAFHDAIEGELRNGGELYDVRDVASKTADNAARMAAQFQRFTHGIGDAVEVECFDRASRIVAWHLNESRRFFGELALPPELVDAGRLDAWLIEHCRRERTQKVPTKKVQQFGPAGLREKAKIEAAVRELEELGRVRLVLDGRRKEIHVNPALLA